MTRAKKNAKYNVLKRLSFTCGTGVTSDHLIRLTGIKGENLKSTFRRVGFYDKEAGKQYYFLTNNMTLVPKTIADSYKSRWQIKLFFKWIAPNDDNYLANSARQLV